MPGLSSNANDCFEGKSTSSQRAKLFSTQQNTISIFRPWLMLVGGIGVFESSHSEAKEREPNHELGFPGSKCIDGGAMFTNSNIDGIVFSFILKLRRVTQCFPNGFLIVSHAVDVVNNFS